MSGIGRGLSAGMQNLARFGMNLAAQGAERKEAEKRDAQKFEALRKYAEASGFLTRDQAAVMSLPELEGTMRGKVLEAETKRQAAQDAAAAARDQATARYQQAMVDQMQGNNRAAERTRTQQEGFNRVFAAGIPATWDGDLMRRYAQMGPARIAAEQFPGGVSPEKLMELDAARSGADGAAPRAFNVGGTSGVYSPKTGQIVPQAQEMTPGQKSTALGRLRAEDRNLLRLLADPTTDPSMREELKSARQALAMEIEGLGGAMPQRPSEPAPAPAGRRMQYDPTTRSVRPVQ